MLSMPSIFTLRLRMVALRVTYPAVSSPSSHLARSASRGDEPLSGEKLRPVNDGHPFECWMPSGTVFQRRDYVLRFMEWTVHSRRRQFCEKSAEHALRDVPAPARDLQI